MQILTNANKCTYQVLVTFAINTTTVGDTGDTGIADGAVSPMKPIPSNLVLKGSATIPASGDGASGGNTGLFDMSGDPSYGFWIEYVTGGKPAGTSTVSWDLKPAAAKGGCVVPTLAGMKPSAAKKALAQAGCTVGKTRRRALGRS